MAPKFWSSILLKNFLQNFEKHNNPKFNFANSDLTLRNESVYTIYYIPLVPWESGREPESGGRACKGRGRERRIRGRQRGLRRRWEELRWWRRSRCSSRGFLGSNRRWERPESLGPLPSMSLRENDKWNFRIFCGFWICRQCEIEKREGFGCLARTVNC